MAKGPISIRTGSIWGKGRTNRFIGNSDRQSLVQEFAEPAPGDSEGQDGLRQWLVVPIVRWYEFTVGGGSMTQTSNRLYDEFARLMTEAAGVAQGVRREAETMFRTQMERFVADLDLVKREEFDVVRELASTARAENEKLQARVAELEARLAVADEAPAKPKAATKAKTAAKPKAVPRTKRSPKKTDGS